MQQHKASNFDFLRFIAATMVIFSHSFPLTNNPEWLARHIGHETFGGLAVGFFFVISGYLITISIQHSRSFSHYFKKRLIRIFPGFICSVLFCALLVGPLFTSLPLVHYFTDGKFWQYFENIGLYFIRFELPGVFTQNPTSSVNGVYWILPMEFTMYVLIAVLALLKLVHRHMALALCFLCFAWHLGLSHQSGSLLHMQLFFLSLYTAFFLGGMAFYLYEKEHGSLVNPLLWCAVLSAVLYCIRFKEGHFILSFALPYLVLGFALFPLPVIKRWGRFGEFSYGIFLYGYPIQQSIVAWQGKEISPYLLFAYTLPLALLCAYASWQLIEAPLLKKK